MGGAIKAVSRFAETSLSAEEEESRRDELEGGGFLILWLPIVFITLIICAMPLLFWLEDRKVDARHRELIARMIDLSKKKPSEKVNWKEEGF
jgi:hypothetical protein